MYFDFLAINIYQGVKIGNKKRHFFFLDLVGRFLTYENMKMRVRGLTSGGGGAIWGGGKLVGGTHNGLNTEWKILKLSRIILRGILC